MKVACLLLASSSIAAAEDLTSIPNARVTLPYSEVRDLIDRAHQLSVRPLPEVPPVLSLISQAEYTLESLPKGGAKGQVVFAVQSLSGGWQALDLLDSSLTVTKVVPATAILVPKGERLALALHEKGASAVTIDFLVPGRTDEGFRFNAVPATASGLTLTGEVSSPIRLSGAQVDAENPLRYHLPSSGSEVIASRIIVRDDKAKAKPTNWEAITESLVTSGPDVLRVRTRLQLLTSEAEPGSVAKVRLPRLATIDQVTSASLESFDSKPANEGGHQWLEIVWQSEGVANRVIEVSYEIPRPLNQGIWKLNLPSLVTPLKTRGTVLIVPPDELDLTARDHKVLAQRTPAWMEEDVAGSATLAIELPGEQILSLIAAPKERLQVALLTIKSALYQTQLVKGGDLLTDCEIKIAHEKSASWTFSLPEGATLLACKLDSSPMSPILRADGMLELPLKNPDGISNVILSFTAKTQAFNPVEGSTSLSLLQTETFCHTQSWAIALPSEYEATAIEGNIPFNPSPPKDERLHLLKQLSRGETPSAQIYYRKKSLDQ
ncbi:MAG: hypothetical protein ACJAVK_001017 [Akkermansiaceae bacterium]|jgi:hypothetical protein